MERTLNTNNNCCKGNRRNTFMHSFDTCISRMYVPSLSRRLNSVAMLKKLPTQLWTTSRMPLPFDAKPIFSSVDAWMRHRTGRVTGGEGYCFFPTAQYLERGGTSDQHCRKAAVVLAGNVRSEYQLCERRCIPGAGSGLRCPQDPG